MENSRVRVGIIGAGNRVRNFYWPILGYLDSQFRTVGFSTRSRVRAEDFIQLTGLDWFSSVTEMIKKVNPDVNIICIPAKSIHNCLLECIKTEKVILVETPVANSIKELRLLQNRLRNASVHIGVAEQKPFLPIERVKRSILDTGLLGEILCVQNDFRSYDYHAIAQLRSYIGSDLRPVLISNTQKTSIAPGFLDRENKRIVSNVKENIDFGTILFENNSLLMHNYSSISKRAPFRTFGSLRIHCEKGSIMDTCLSVLNNKTGKTINYEIKDGIFELANETKERIELHLFDGTEILWSNPFSEHPLNDDSIAIAYHLCQIRQTVLQGVSPLYDLNQALLDLELMFGLRLSAAKQGRPVRFPVSGNSEYWSSKSRYFHNLFRIMKSKISQ